MKNLILLLSFTVCFSNCTTEAFSQIAKPEKQEHQFELIDQNTIGCWITINPTCQNFVTGPFPPCASTTCVVVTINVDDMPVKKWSCPVANQILVNPWTVERIEEVLAGTFGRDSFIEECIVCAESQTCLCPSGTPLAWQEGKNAPKCRGVGDTSPWVRVKTQYATGEACPDQGGGGKEDPRVEQSELRND